MCRPALVCLLLLLPLPALAGTVDVQHTPLTPETSAVVRVRLVPGTSPVFGPSAFFRAVGASEFQRLPLVPETGVEHGYLVSVPEALVAKGFEYFLETFDEEGAGPFRAGAPEKPLAVGPHRAAPAAPVAAAAPEVLPPPPPPLIVIEDARPEVSAPAPAGTSRLRLAGYVVAGAGAALLLGGGVTGGLALSDYGKLKDASAAGDAAAYDQFHDAAKLKSQVADGLFVAGGVAAATGVVLVLVGWDLPVTASVSPAGAGLAVAGTF